MTATRIKKHPKSAAERAQLWLRDHLPQDGSRVASAVIQAAAVCENPPISARTLQRASKALGVVVTEQTGPRGRLTFWELAQASEPTPPTSPAERIAPRPPDEVAPEVTADVKPTIRRGELGRRAKGILNQPFDKGTHP